MCPRLLQAKHLAFKVDDASFWACNKKLPITVGAGGIYRHSLLQRILKRTQLLPFLFMTQLLPLRLVYSAKSLRSVLLGLVAISGVSGWLAGMGSSYVLAADRNQKNSTKSRQKSYTLVCRSRPPLMWFGPGVIWKNG